MTKTTAFKNQYADSRDSMTNLLFRKWTIAIILSLGAETKRYSMLHRSLPGVTQKVLTEHLKQLERAGIVRCFAPTQLLPISLCQCVHPPFYCFTCNFTLLDSRVLVAKPLERTPAADILRVCFCLNYCKTTFRKRPIASCLLGRTPKALTPVFRIANQCTKCPSCDAVFVAKFSYIVDFNIANDFAVALDHPAIPIVIIKHILEMRCLVFLGHVRKIRTQILRHLWLANPLNGNRRISRVWRYQAQRLDLAGGWYGDGACVHACHYSLALYFVIIKHMHKPLRGVNLGGWLVLERWMTPSVFAGTDASNEHQLMMQPDGPERIAKHRQEFMTEADFAWLHAHGIEALRVPVGYWVLESQDGYLEATKQLDWCFAMAKKYHMRVLLDLHAAPGAQNLGDHSGSGNRMPQTGWYQAKNRRATRRILRQLAERYGTSPQLWGIELLNEPFTKNWLQHWLLRLWSRRTTGRLRRNVLATTRIIISDAYQLPRWRRAQPRDWLDIHHYQCFGAANLALVDYDQHASIVDEFTHMHQSLQRPTIIGEWSAILPPAIAMTPPTITAYILAQQTAFASADAHFFWSYKTESNDGWNYRWLVEQGIMP